MIVAIAFWSRAGSLMSQFGVPTLMTPMVDTDWKNPGSHALILGQASLSEPAPYYNNPRTANSVRIALQNFMTKAILAIAMELGINIHPLGVPLPPPPVVPYG